MSLTLGKISRTVVLALALASPLVLSQPAPAVEATAPPATQVHYRSAEIDGVAIAYREAGDPSRPTVLLLHGFPDSNALWREVAPALVRAGYRVVAPDQRGFGFSSAPEGVTHYRVEHIVVGVAETEWAPGTDEVDVAFAVGTVDMAAVAMGDEERRSAHGRAGAHRRVDASGNYRIRTLKESL